MIFQIKKDDVLTVIQVNVLRIPKKRRRCLECICIKGDEGVFIEAFDSLDLHILRKKDEIENL